MKEQKPLKHTNKFVEFLNGCNTIAIRGERDFTVLKSMLKRVGLDCFSNLRSDKDYPDATYWDLLHIAQINHCVINCSTILVEYQPGKGLTFGYKSFEESEKWYEMKPWSIAEVRAELN